MTNWSLAVSYQRIFVAFGEKLDFSYSRDRTLSQVVQNDCQIFSRPEAVGYITDRTPTLPKSAPLLLENTLQFSQTNL